MRRRWDSPEMPGGVFIVADSRGVILSNERMSARIGTPSEVRSSDSGGHVVRSALAYGHGRETFVIPRSEDLTAVAEASRIAEWYRDQPLWLDWGLAKL